MENLYKDRNYFKNGCKLIVIVLFCSLFTIVSCKAKDSETANTTDEVKNEQSESSEVSENIEVMKPASKKTEGVSVVVPEVKLTKTKAEFAKFKDGLEFERGNDVPTAHEKYLNDKFEFDAVPFKEFDTKKTAVVGSYVCKFYPLVELKTNDDLSKLGEGTPVPFATVLPIYGSVGGDLGDWETPGFHFEDNYNYFYKTKWNGKEGWVFGADLEGLEFSTKENYILSLQYQHAGAPSKFYPVSGRLDLKPSVIKRLEEEKLAFEDVSYDEYRLGVESPDDMIALYSQHTWEINYGETVFITTDLMAHTRHLIFDRTLQLVEETALLPKLEKLIDSFLAELDKVNGAGPITANDETLEKAKLYFQTAKAIIESSTKLSVTIDKYGRKTKEYKKPNTTEVLSKYPKTVQKEIAEINEASGFKQSPLFTFADGAFTKENYSQYKPRGHYTKNEVLGTYFKVMMLFGRAHFLIAEAGDKPLTMDGSAPSDSETLTNHMTPIALLFTEVVKNNTDLYNQWADIFNPITDLIGISDDLSFNEVLPLWKSYNVKNFKEWSSNKENIIAFMKEAHSKLKPPAIAGASVFYTASEKDHKQPMGWRLFGQRYTFDSFIHQLTSTPRLDERMMVSGLDIMKAFSSNTANTYLADEYTTYPNLNTTLTNLEKKFLKYPEKAGGKTYYGTVLNEVALQARFDQGSGFYFTESPAWGKKSLLSAHGSWAELRHDTILYTKQNYAERGAGIDPQPTVRTEPIPKPVHYIEPNLAYWKNASMSTQLLANTLTAYDLIDDDILEKLTAVIEICERATKIVELEIKDQPVSPDDLHWISKIPSKLVPLVLVGIDLVSSYIEDDDLQMAIVADVFTNAETSTALETAVGIPYRIYVPLNDNQGGKRIAVGYCFNYYEFTQSSSNRLNDEEWKKMVYAENDSNIEELKPDWARNISIPKN